MSLLYIVFFNYYGTINSILTKLKITSFCIFYELFVYVYLKFSKHSSPTTTKLTFFLKK